MGDAELAADRAQVIVLALEREAGSASDQPQRRKLRQLVDDFLGQAVAQVLLVLGLGQVDEGQHREGGPRIVRAGRRQRFGGVGRRRRRLGIAVAVVLVEGECPAPDQQQQRDDREFGSGNALLTAVAVVPGHHEDDRQADEQCQRRELLELEGPAVGVAEELEALQEAPGPCDVEDSPLRHLATAQGVPPAFGAVHRWRLVHATVLIG